MDSKGEAIILIRARGMGNVAAEWYGWLQNGLGGWGCRMDWLQDGLAMCGCRMVWLGVAAEFTGGAMGVAAECTGWQNGLGGCGCRMAWLDVQICYVVQCTVDIVELSHHDLCNGWHKINGRLCVSDFTLTELSSFKLTNKLLGGSGNG